MQCQSGIQSLSNRASGRYHATGQVLSKGAFSAIAVRGLRSR
jgi:hypothetical protein